MMELSFEVPQAMRLQAVLRTSYQRIPMVVNRATGKIAGDLERLIKRGIRSQAPGGKQFKPLADSTKAMKKSSKALINHGDLLNSIKAQPMTGTDASAWFIGVHRSAKGKDGQDLANIAAIHEFGTDPYEIKITARMRRWWLAMTIKGLFKGTLHPLQSVIQHPGVPARPFLGPSYDEWVKTAQQNWTKHVERDLLRSWR